MARDDRTERASTRYHYDDYSPDERDREKAGHRRRHRPRSYEDEDYLARRQRRDRRRAEEARREVEPDIDELRARRASYYATPETPRRREAQRMAQEVAEDRTKARSRQPEVRRDGTTRRRKRRERVVEDDRSDGYVYDRPRSGVVEEVTVRRIPARNRSDEGGSSRRTAESHQSGSNSTSGAKLSRSVSAREPSTRVYMSTRPSVRRSSAVKLPIPVPTPLGRTQSVSVRGSQQSAAQRRSTGGLLATLFKPPPKPVTTVIHKEVSRAECLVCMNDDVPVNKTAKLGCGHRMCHSCLKRQFTLSVNDPQHMPPTCCTTDHIPLKHVDRLFDKKFKILWNKKYQEYTTANRLYCPTKGCGEWIKPNRIRVDVMTGRKYARCGHCQIKVCVLCNGRFHTRRECPRDEETNRLVQMAKEKGWQRCYSCKAMVELKEGCNHMTCRCAAQFCMVCAAPWKTCNCPWFNYNMDEEDRLNDMRVPYMPHRDVEVIEIHDEPTPPPIRRISTRVRRRPDPELDRADEVLAAHLQAQLRMNTPPAASQVGRDLPAAQVYGLGNSGGHHMNDSYTVRPLATSAARTAVRNSTTPRFFSRRVIREVARPTTARAPTKVTASTMAGLSRDGTKRGANRVGTWLNHVEVDADAIATAPHDIEVDDWKLDGSVVGID